MHAETSYDLAVIGGGINGCGVARDAAGRGLKVLLLERNDLASGTSQASTKLIHGGLRYLEQRNFNLVRESLLERKRLWTAAPHIVRHLRFVIPQNDALRSKWVLRGGLFLYDRIGGRNRLPSSKSVKLHRPPYRGVLQERFNDAFEYSDCWVDDARLVVFNAMDAVRIGATVLTRSELISATRGYNEWNLNYVDHATGDEHQAFSKMVVNAAGPWAQQVLDRSNSNVSGGARLIKGSHIVVPKVFEHAQAYAFQAPDRRVIFAIPYERNYTLIGTTDVNVETPESDKPISDDEVNYLCKVVNSYFEHPVQPKDVVWSYTGVRPLHGGDGEEARKVSRDYALLDDGLSPPMLSIFGGKLTTYRNLAEQVLKKLLKHNLLKSRSWTRSTPLPGGDFGTGNFRAVLQRFSSEYPFLPTELAERLFTQHGTLAWRIVGDSRSLSKLGKSFGGQIYQREVDYLINNEWARCAEDIVWRRTKQGLCMSKTEIAQLEDYVKERVRKKFGSRSQ